MLPAFTAAPGATPRAASTALRLYCVSRVSSESAWAGSTLVKYSILAAAPNTPNESAPSATAQIASTTRVAGSQTASATQTGRPRCGSTIAPAAKSAAIGARPRQAQ